MQILSVHNRYQIRGGEEECYEAEAILLREMGHQVDVYEQNNDRLNALNKLQMAVETVWSTETYDRIKQHLSKQPYDIVHVHNFFPLISPSVYYAAKAQNVPVVQTLHNYRLLCPNALFFRNGRVCEDCLGKALTLPGVLHGCYRNSVLASGGTAAMLSVHRAMSTWTKTVDAYIALTEFARQKFIEGGIPAEKILVKPHFVHPDPGIGEGLGNYAIYVGRLSVEKGLDVLLAAWELLGSRIPLKIVGDGPLADLVVKASERMPEIQWLGRKSMLEVYALMGEALFLIFPSKWYETFGRVAIEAFAKGTPAIAADIGALSELVECNRTGLHFTPGSAKDLAAKVEWAIAHPIKLQQMRQEARAEFEAKYTAPANYQKLMEIYKMASILKKQG